MIDNRTGKMWDKGYVNCYEAVSPQENDQRVGMSSFRMNAFGTRAHAQARLRLSSSEQGTRYARSCKLTSAIETFSIRCGTPNTRRRGHQTCANRGVPVAPGLGRILAIAALVAIVVLAAGYCHTPTGLA
jgi:hypothetical protein